MITHIHIQNFAIIRELDMELKPGLNILTGETGAGKSIVIEAVSMALGSRADTDYVRTGCDKATVTVVADSVDASMDDLLAELAIDCDETLILHREINAVGRNLCRINGTVVPLSALSRAGRMLADIHGQYDHQSLLDANNHIELLDLYGRQEIGPVRNMATDFYNGYAKSAAALDRLESRASESARQKDLLCYELNEIQSAAIAPGEDEALEHEIHLMQNSERIIDALTSSHEALSAQETSALSVVGGALTGLRSVESFSPDLQRLAQSLGDAYYTLEDVARDVRNYTDTIDFSPRELEDKIARMDVLEKLKRKYGGTLEGVFAHAEKAEQELSVIENDSGDMERLNREKDLNFEQLKAASARLRELRKRYATELSTAIMCELNELHFNDAVFETRIEECAYSPTGADRVEFLISANKGEKPKPLASIASGGELSRIMLAIKRIIGDLDRIPTMIFDEIDTGISGAAAGVVGRKLRQISENRQIVCITHLPQIAAFGEHHCRIVKTSDERSTHTTVVPLNESERIEEIARLLSGTEVTQKGRDSARELLDLSQRQF